MDFEEIILKNNFALFGWVKKKNFFFFTLDYKSKGRIQPLSCFKIHVHTHISFFFSNRLIRSAGIYLGKGNLKEKSIVGCCISFFIIVSYLFPMEWLEFIQIKWKFPRFFFLLQNRFMIFITWFEDLCFDDHSPKHPSSEQQTLSHRPDRFRASVSGPDELCVFCFTFAHTEAFI